MSWHPTTHHPQLPRGRRYLTPRPPLHRILISPIVIDTSSRVLAPLSPVTELIHDLAFDSKTL